jgi:predicted transcriptional regulator
VRLGAREPGSSRRPRIAIYAKVLWELAERPSQPTRISRVCNLSYDVCMEILGELEVKGLVSKSVEEGHETYHATQDGYQWVLDFGKVWERVYPGTNLR